MIRQIVQDFAVLEDSKIIQDDDKFLVVKALEESLQDCGGLINC